tara:strand:+ start:233 stop:1258 length:1026 start_codon:yes stop_codon:yes gene_type:complete
MSKKSLNVILKNKFNNNKELSQIYFSFAKKIKSFKTKVYLIAVSGGPDSLALTALSKVYSQLNKSKFYYVLIDHNLRKNSSQEAQLVKRLLRKHKINLNIVKNRKLINSNIQSKAREVRYDLIKDYCKKKKIKIVLTAHNLEDQVETFFIRLSRGSGLYGLSSMKQVNQLNRNIRLVRPLLDFKKKQLIKISKITFGKYFNDPSNKNKKYLRSKIRKLKRHLEKSGINYDQVFKSINNLASSRDILDKYFQSIYKKTVRKKQKKIYINFNNFSKYDNEIKMRILMNSIVDLSNSYYSPRSKKIFNLINGLKVGKKGQKFRLAGCSIHKDKNNIILGKENKN